MKPTVQLFRVDVSPVSESFYQEASQALNELPDCIAFLLAQARYEVVLCRLLVELFPEMQGIPFSTQDEEWGSTERKKEYWDNTLGACHPYNRVILYPEFYMDSGAVRYSNTQDLSCKNILYHEIGHAIDHLPALEKFRRFSESMSFVEAYCRDLGRLPKIKRRKLNYSERVRGEIFAETFSAVLEKRSQFSRMQMSYFPHVAAYIREQILAYLAEIYDDPESLQLLYATLSNMPWRRPRKSFQELVCKARHVSGV